MTQPFQALRVHQTEAGPASRIETLRLAELSAGEVVIRTRYAGINYKDSLAVTGRAKVLVGSPRVPGIELVGTVEHSEASAFAPGDEVLVHGFNTGIEFDGGFAERVRVQAAHVMRLPAGLSARETALLGVPAFTVAIALERFEAGGLRPEAGPVVVSGATGAVGMCALAILKRAGYRVVALTRRSEWSDALHALGADEVLPTSAIEGQQRPLERARFAAAIDNVGGEVLSWMLRSLQDQGQLAAVGNAAGIGFSCNVLPFILRQARLFGVAANAPWETRHRLWARLAGDWKPDLAALGRHGHEVDLAGLQAQCLAQVDGKTSGRTLLRFGDEEG